MSTRPTFIGLTVFAIMVIGTLVTATSLPNETTTYSIKAAFLVNMLGFIEISPRPLSKPLICTITSEEINQNIKNYLLANNLVERVGVKNISYNRSLDQCWTLYIENNQVRGSGFMLAEARNKGILSIVGENYIGSGSMVYLHFIDKKLRFDFDKNLVDAAKIKIDARLLNLARKVYK
ncbi:YfiR family protein [Pelobacter propionicus]|uniref:Uncharacterized protein n=1 Tax=Pelobacter propionicus (strain DSM 2379 / NBRC 103807 / OttBd1) TaxID=338966 RepID=A0R7L4_PELPD|nr:YfiR family protein [Pelobacter propionicus]ABL01224.1 hypothetical protein Ppro_3632 [Pelobacter propionicus DSM 2379]